MCGKRVRAVVYARVSTEDQAEKGYSLEAQIEDCARRAMELGYERRELLILADDVSGATLERPGLTRLRELVSSETERPEAVIVFDPDRLARKLALQLLLTDELTRRGICLEFVNFEWNNTPEGRMFYQLRGMFAEFEREKIRERTIRGRLTKLKTRGKLSFDPRLYGYRFDTEKDELVVDPAEADVVRYIFAAGAGGASGEEIARRLAENGVPAPRGTVWYGSTVTRILRNPSYLGTYWAYKVDYHQGYRRERPRSEQFALAIEPIIAPDLFEQAQLALNRNRTLAGRPPERQTLLSGFASCSCGAAMVAGAAAGGRDYAYYVCATRHKPSRFADQASGRCATGYWNTEAADAAVWREVCGFIAANAPLAAVLLGDAAFSQQGNKASAADPALALIEARLEDCERKRRRLVDLYMAGGVGRRLYDEKVRQLEEERERLLVRLRELGQREHGIMNGAADSSDTFPGFGVWSAWNGEEWERRLAMLGFEHRKQVVRLLVESVEFHEGRTLKLRLRLPHCSQNEGVSESHGGL